MDYLMDTNLLVRRVDHASPLRGVATAAINTLDAGAWGCASTHLQYR